MKDILLTPDDNRFVMFPIQDDTIWQMYKKQVDCFGGPKRSICPKIVGAI